MGQIVIPIYYHVRPSDVRRQEGDFCLQKWEDHDMNKVESWRDALVKAGNLSGWELDHNHDMALNIDRFAKPANLAAQEWMEIKDDSIKVCLMLQMKGRRHNRWNDRGQIVIPIYYDVDPSEVRRQTGHYEKAFSKHESMNPSKVALWRKTLEMACNLNGWFEAKGYQHGTSGSWHDVYISFRHRDTECHIVEDIYDALHQEGVSTYKDEVTLSRKESALIKAIERSRLFVIIFTKKFAVNSWYLDEVAKIIECMKVKKTTCFAGISQCESNALVEATNAPGLEYSKFRSSADFVKKIVEEIKNGLSAVYN
ncbi:hypothetical protein L1987_79374 [Smallanthus sonchifolius]|uniref:Uncharacterized protein n=1 Tax=Smallanthus sonchifolius TaxID=185202 RepID=A0ACB8ZGB1_9ASTR|nr:hypothetical protein L1987_79374 [Smallanthus sonchifolius]